jgi:predicted dehydrogenase
MLLAKSCHDIDLMMWMMNHTKPTHVSSFGCDFQYGIKNKPEGAGNRCMVDCPLNGECIYSAEKHYIDVLRWNQYVWEDDPKKIEMSVEEKRERMKTDNPFGECLWNFDRGGNVDHQTLIVNFENGATGSFSMIGGAAKSERNIHIIGTKGEIKGLFESSKYVIRNMSPSESYAGYTEREIDLNVTGDMIGAKGGHGGGDENLVLDFVDYINGHEPSVSCTTLEDSVISHHTVFCAGESRKSGKTVKL